jgi:AcrR family transcriptional regulator
MTIDEVSSVRERMTNETGKLIAKGGYGAFSMRRLAEAVNLTPGAIYRYFPTKQHLLIAFLSDAIGKMNADICDAVRADQPSVDNLRRMLMIFGHFCLADKDRFRAIFLEDDMGEVEEVSNSPDTVAGYMAIVAETAKAQAQGAIRDMPASHAANLLWGAVHGAVTLASTVREVDFGNPEKFLADALDMALRGLSPSSNM